MKYYFPLKQREYPKKLNKFVIAGILFLFAFTYYFSQGSLCKLNAASISDYCYRYALNINNNTNSSDPNYLGNKAHYPVLLANVDQNGWINSNYIDKFGWSIFPYQASLQEEYQVLLQDLSSVSASQWYVMPSLFTGDNQLSILMGANNIQRNQGMFFAGEDVGGDYLKVVNHNDFNVSDFKMEIQIEDSTVTALAPQTTHTIIEKYDESDPNPANHTGFKLEYLDSGSIATVRAWIDNYMMTSFPFIPCSSPTTTSTCNTHDDYIVFSYSGGIMHLTVNGVYQFQAASLTTNTEDIYIGANYECTFSNYLNDYERKLIPF